MVFVKGKCVAFPFVAFLHVLTTTERKAGGISCTKSICYFLNNYLLELFYLHTCLQREAKTNILNSGNTFGSLL